MVIKFTKSRNLPRHCFDTLLLQVVVYVSCNPATFADNLKVLQETHDVATHLCLPLPLEGVPVLGVVCCTPRARVRGLTHPTTHRIPTF